MKIDEVRKLIRLFEESNIGELEVSKWWGRVRISRKPNVSENGSYVVSSSIPVEAGPAPRPPAAEAAPAPPADAHRTDGEAGLTPVTSPMVGTFYRAPAPDADPYVEVGDRIEPGQTICIIEAMKLMNEIQAEKRGKVARILPANGQPVEYGQTLLLIEES